MRRNHRSIPCTQILLAPPRVYPPPPRATAGKPPYSLNRSPRFPGRFTSILGHPKGDGCTAYVSVALVLPCPLPIQHGGGCYPLSVPWSPDVPPPSAPHSLHSLGATGGRPILSSINIRGLPAEALCEQSEQRAKEGDHRKNSLLIILQDGRKTRKI